MIWSFLFVSLSAWAQSGMPLRESPACEPNLHSISEKDVAEWIDFTNRRVPPLNRLLVRDSKHPELTKVKAQLARNSFITGAYLDLCRDRVLDQGTCLEKPDPSFLWACAAARGSATAGSYMKDGISAYEKDMSSGQTWIDTLIGRNAVLPSVKLLGDANGKIFETVGWQHFAAAKCGNAYAVALLRKSKLPNKTEYQDFWKKAETEKTSGRSLQTAKDTSTEDLLLLEQELIQPEMESNQFVLGALSRNSLFSSGVVGAASFRDYAVKTLGTRPLSVNLANFDQRFSWELNEVLPKIFADVLQPQCKGMNQQDQLSRLVGEKQFASANAIDGLGTFARQRGSTGVASGGMSEFQQHLASTTH